MSDFDLELEQALVDTYSQLGMLQREIKEFAEARGIGMFEVKKTDGTLSMTDIVVAKASVVPALIEVRRRREAEERLEKAKQSFLDAFRPGKTDVACAVCDGIIVLSQEMPGRWRHVSLPVEGEPHEARP